MKVLTFTFERVTVTQGEYHLLRFTLMLRPRMFIARRMFDISSTEKPLFAIHTQVRWENFSMFFVLSPLSVTVDISGKKKIEQGQKNDLHYSEQNKNIP